MKLIWLYLVFMGFVSAFSLNQWVPIPMAISFLILASVILITLKSKKVYLMRMPIMILLLMFSIIILISFMNQIFDIGFQSKGLTHTLSYFCIILMYYIIIEMAFKTSGVPVSKIFKYVTIGILLVSIITIIEFISKNFLNINFDQYIYRPSSEREFDALYITGFKDFFRTRGTAQESGPLAMYLLMFYPFLVYYYKVFNPSSKKLILSSTLVILSVITTFSATGFFELIVALLVVSFLSLKNKLKRGFTGKEIFSIYTLSCGIIAIVIYKMYSSSKTIFFSGIIDKLTFNNTSSGDSRIQRWSDAFSIIKLHPIIGNGPGISAVLNGTGSTSMYLEVLAESGFLGFSLLMAIFIYIFYLITKMKSKVKLVYLFSFIIMVIHMAVISEYWSPWIWALFAITSYHYNLLAKPLNIEKLIAS